MPQIFYYLLSNSFDYHTVAPNWGFPIKLVMLCRNASNTDILMWNHVISVQANGIMMWQIFGLAKCLINSFLEEMTIWRGESFSNKQNTPLSVWGSLYSYLSRFQYMSKQKFKRVSTMRIEIAALNVWWEHIGDCTFMSLFDTFQSWMHCNR